MSELSSQNVSASTIVHLATAGERLMQVEVQLYEKGKR